VTRLAVVHVVLTDAFAGTERYVANLAAASHARGAEVTVLGGEPVAMRAALPAGVAHHAVTGVVAAVALLRRLPRPDVVHTHLTAADVAAAAAFPLPGRRPAIIATRHIAARRGSTVAARAAALVVRARLDAQIAISRFVAVAVDGPSEVILTGVPDAPAAAVVGSRTVVVAQRLEPEKDTATALRAWAASDLGPAGWTLLVAGRGSEEADLRRLAERLDVSASVRFAGQVADLGVVLGDAAALLATARAEPYGLSVVEAMAAGLPVVATGAGGHLETVGVVPGARLFPAGDGAAAAAHLRALAADPAGSQAYGRTLRAHQQAHLSLGAFARSVEAVYRRTTAGRGPYLQPGR
jgi:glycosyltransferase involved in cell wall biosynthesis